MFWYKCTVFRECNEIVNWEADKIDENSGHPFTSFQITAHRLTVQDTIWHYAFTLFPFPIALYMGVPWKFYLTWGDYSLDLFLSEKCYTNMGHYVSWVITDQSRLPIPVQGKQNHLCHLYPSTIWQVVHMQCGNLLSVLCLDVHENQFTEDGNCHRHHHE
jgi:hypothetical protein